MDGDEQSRSRRRILTGGAAVVGSAAGAVVLGATGAEAANGSPILAGRANTATAATTLTNTSTSGAAHGVLISTRGGYGFQAMSTGNNGLAGITSAASKAGVIATHNGPKGTGAALIANGRNNTGASISNTNTDKPALFVRSTWNEPGRSATAIRAVSSSPTGVGVEAEGAQFGVVARATGFAALGGLGLDGAVGGDLFALSLDETVVPVGLRVSSAIAVGEPPFALGTAIEADGAVYVNGQLTKSSGTFRIDHPLDPANKYLSHSFVESPDMANVYNGTVETNTRGEAVVELPEWFDSLNKDVRYQLTAIGAPAPNLHVKKKVAGGSFTIAGAEPGQEVCWQLIGTRKDAWANAHRVPVEEDKPAKERGTFLFPRGFGQPESKRLGYRDPTTMR